MKSQFVAAPSSTPENEHRIVLASMFAFAARCFVGKKTPRFSPCRLRCVFLGCCLSCCVSHLCSGVGHLGASWAAKVRYFLQLLVLCGPTFVTRIARMLLVMARSLRGATQAERGRPWLVNMCCVGLGLFVVPLGRNGTSSIG